MLIERVISMTFKEKREYLDKTCRILKESKLDTTIEEEWQEIEFLIMPNDTKDLTDLDELKKELERKMTIVNKLRNIHRRIFDVKKSEFDIDVKRVQLLELILDLMNDIDKDSIDIKVKITIEEIKDMQSELKIEIEKHDRNMLNIMGTFLAIFSLIGVNFSFFQHFDNISVTKWILLIIVVNASLMSTIIGIFICIRILFVLFLVNIH